MTSKERVYAALNHQETDRVPLDIGAINNTAMHQILEEKIKKKLGLEDHGYLIKSRFQKITVPDQSIVDYFGVDTCSIYMNESTEWRQDEQGNLYDMWGIKQVLNPDGLYYNMGSHPMEDIDTIELLDNYKFPEITDYMVEGLAERLEQNQDKFTVLEGFRECMVGVPSWLRRNQNFYMDLLEEPEFCDEFHRRLLDFYIRWVDFVFEKLGDSAKYLDCVKFSDDMGTQNSMLFSVNTYRERIKPYQAALYAHVKEKYGKKILLHSCGAIRPIIDDLIEIGVDALNPVQISAKGMEAEGLKRDFGSRITFWGGGVDTQHVLPNGTLDEIRADVKKNLDVFKRGGGYVFCQVHNLQGDLDIDRVLAMYDAYREFGQY